MSLVERVKPGAEELAVNPGVTENGKPAVVAAVQRAGGGGQVMVLTVDSTWLWSRLPRMHRAGRHALRPLLESGDALAGRPRPRRTTAVAHRVPRIKPYYDVGKRVTLTISRQPRADVDVSATQVAVEIIGPDGKPLPPERTPTPRASSGQPDVFTAEFTPSASGRYEVNATLNADGKVLANQTTEFRAQGADYELADQGTNPARPEGVGEGDGRRLPRRGPRRTSWRTRSPARTAWGRNIATNSGIRRSCSGLFCCACRRSGSCDGGTRWYD